MWNIPRDAYVALFLLLLSSAFFYTTFGIESPPLATVGSEVWPRVILVPLIVLSLALLSRSLAQGPDKDRAEHGGLLAWLLYYRRPIGVLVLYLAFLVTMQYLGMLVAGLLFAFLSMLYLGDRTFRRAALYALVSLVAIGGMWGAFIFWLGVILPRGSWTGI